MFKAKITAKGQLTLPKGLREKMGLNTGDHVLIRETNEGYLLEKEMDEQRFHKFIGYLNQENNTDNIIEELRGE